MTTNQPPIPEPTSLTTVVVGKREGQTVVAVRMDNDDIPWAVTLPGFKPFHWYSWSDLCRELTDIRVVPAADLARPTKVAGCARCDRIEAHSLGNEALLGRRRDQLAKAREEIDQLKACISDLAAKPEPGPWLRGDELEAAIPTLKAGDVVEVEHGGHTASGELQPQGPSCLVLWVGVVRTATGKPGAYVDALRVIERAPDHREVWRSGDNVDELVRICGMAGAHVDVSHVDGLGVTGPVQYVDTAGMDVGSAERGYRVMFDRAGWTITATAPEPEPGADIPDEVVEAALAAIPWASEHQLADVRAALAAADTKRAELEGQA